MIKTRQDLFFVTCSHMSSQQSKLTGNAIAFKSTKTVREGRLTFLQHPRAGTLFLQRRTAVSNIKQSYFNDSPRTLHAFLCHRVCVQKQKDYKNVTGVACTMNCVREIRFLSWCTYIVGLQTVLLGVSMCLINGQHLKSYLQSRVHFNE